METNFELKNVTKTITPDNLSEYTLSFSDSEELKSIVLTGSGKLKEVIKI